MKLRAYLAIIAVIIALTASVATAAPNSPSSWVADPLAAALQSSISDFDNDGIPDDLDPDDDGDGVSDSDDYAPFDPGIQVQPVEPVDTGGGDTDAAAPPPVQVDPIASNQDSDGDGIPNDLDPDDSNNGITDEDEPSVIEVDPTTVPTAEPTETQQPISEPTATEVAAPTAPLLPESTESPAPVAVAPAPAPLVNALPSTGSGAQDVLPSLTIVIIALIGLAAVRLRSNQPPKQ